jgi:hypothetical protein
VPSDPIGDDNPIEAILLTAFPNPGRIGCPTPDVIKAMANQEIGRDDPAWAHIWNCSPCFADFKVVRDARVARVEREYQRKRTRRNLLAGAVAVAVSSAAAYFAAVEFRGRPRHEFAVVSIDLTNIGTTRGAAETDTSIGRLPRRLDEIHLTLPRFSASGRYVVAVLESRSENTAVALGSATTQGADDHQTVIVTLDLSEARPGRYFLGTRLESNGREEIPSYYPILVSD